MGYKFMELEIITNDIPKGCIQCQSHLHMSFYCRDHPHPVVRAYNHYEHPLEDVEVIEVMMLILSSFELLMWVNRLLEEYESVTKHKGLLEEIYDFCVDNNFHENPLYEDYQERMDAISQANILQELSLMQEQEEEDIIEPQEEESIKNDDPEEHGDEGWNGHCPEAPTNGNSFDIINVLLDENDEGYDLPAAPHPLHFNITVKLQPLTFQASPLIPVHRYSPKCEYEFTYMMPMHRK